MSQQMNVVRCAGCQMFQVEIKKKAKKWQCKICGAKQSLMQTFFEGSGKECRIQVQSLNSLKANEQHSNNAIFSFNNYDDAISSSTKSLKRPRVDEVEQSAEYDQYSINEMPNSNHKKYKFEDEISFENVSDGSSIFPNINDDINDNVNNIENVPNNVQHLKLKENNIEAQLDYSSQIQLNVYQNKNDVASKVDYNIPMNEQSSNYAVTGQYVNDNQNKESIFSLLLTEDGTSDSDDANDLNRSIQHMSTDDSPPKINLPQNNLFESNNDIDLSLDF